MSVSTADRSVFGALWLLGILFISSLVCPPFLSLFLNTLSFSLDLLSFIPLVDCILPLSFVVVQSFAITVLP